VRQLKVVIPTLWVIGILLSGPAPAQLPFGEQSYEYELGEVMPGATEFDRVETHWRAFDSAAERRLLGYVLLTDDLVDVPGYSGKTMNTLVGIDTEGTITGIRIVRHSEPIVLIGLAERVMHEFVDQYLGKSVKDRILITDNPKAGYIGIDGISGATVTAIAENATVLEAGRLVGRTEGFVSAAEVRTRRPSDRFTPLSWKQLLARDAIGSLVVRPEELDLPDEGILVDLRFTVLDPPSIGKNLLGERFYAVVRDRLDEQGGSALYVASNGEFSFKGAGFARGGIFDRFQLEQQGGLFVFRDVDFINLPALEAEGAPHFSEGGIFFVGEAFDPTEPFSFQLTVPYRVRDKRSYASFLTDHRLPDAFIESEIPFWVERWRTQVPAVAFFVLLIGGAAYAFIRRQQLLPHRKLIHRSVAFLAAVVLGLILKAQPSTTQILTFVGSAVERKFPAAIYLSEPLIFMFWITIGVTLFVWGRGFFCGWLCPYGALLELLISIWTRLVPDRVLRKIESWEPPQSVRLGKYFVFLVILGVSFFSLPTAEALDEVEPFKTFVLRLVRPEAFVLYFFFITILSTISHRFFCRFLCPLGGALAIPSGRPALPLVRYDKCLSCKICARGCEPRAISFEDGKIDYRECLQCWDCQSTGQDTGVCPELIVAAKENRPPRVVTGALLMALLLCATGAEARVWTVTPSSGTLGETIAGSSAGDTLILESGTYHGSVTVDRPLTVRSEQGAILDGEGTGDVLIVAAPNVTIEGLTLRNCGRDLEASEAGIRVEQHSLGVRLLGNTIEDCRFGIWIHGSVDAEIVENHILGIEALQENDRGDCIHLWDATRTTIARNEVSYCRDGIYMELSTETEVVGNRITHSRYSVHTMWCDRSVYNENFAAENLVGLAIMFSEDIEARENILHNNATHGMLLVQVTHSTASGNVIIGNTKGLFVYNSLYNRIQDNLLARNNMGVHYWGGSEENEITDNTFIDNQIQVKFVAAHDQSWDRNYWSDYGGWDVDANGTGEVPYRSNTLVDALLWDHPSAKLLLTSPAFQLLALIEREFPMITVPKAVDSAPWMSPTVADWHALLDRYPADPTDYYGRLRKMPHIPGEHH
jgi:NosR/NirI family nitrous oxide reductase transcriptional regulator